MLKYHYHPLSSYCWKALIALYELDVPFERCMVNLGDPDSSGAFRKLSPMGNMPALEDGPRSIWESSIVIEYLDQRFPGAPNLIPLDSETALKVRHLDRAFDLYVHEPMQRIVAEHMRPADKLDPLGIDRAHAKIDTAYAFFDVELAGREWAAGDAFSLADCAAAPALFYANIVHPIGSRSRVSAYLERLKARPSFARVLEEARPYFHMYPAGKIE